MDSHFSLKSLIMVLTDPFKIFLKIIILLDFKLGAAIPVSNVYGG